MSARISVNGNIYRFNSSTNTFQQQLIRWKGKTFNQIISSIQKNKNSTSNVTPSSLMKPFPLIHYRKEFTSIPSSNIIQRNSIKIDDINTPNGYSISNITTEQGTLTTIIDTNNNITNNCSEQQENARKRVRSAGMYPKKFNKNRNNDSIYHSSTNDYLVSRSKTFEQNQYQYYRSGPTKTEKPGQTLRSFYNDNSAQGIQHCIYSGDIPSTSIENFPYKRVSYKPNNWKFAIQGAVDSSLRTTMINNLHISSLQGH